MGGRPRRRHVGLEARTLPTLFGYESRRESSGALSFDPALRTCGDAQLPGEGCVCVSWGVGGGGPLAPSQGRGKSGCE